VPGDELTATLSVDSLRQIGGADIIGTRSEITAADGSAVCTAYATLVHRGEGA
jgi:acyl dehydratase